MREFYVMTPRGELRVQATQERDNRSDFPGVRIDLVRDGKNDELLTCVEYDRCYDRIQTCVYQPGSDEPQEVVVHELAHDEDEYRAFADFANNTNWQLFYQQKLALLELMDRISPDDEKIQYWMDGLVGLLDALGDAAENANLFTYPERDDDDRCFDGRFNDILQKDISEFDT